MSNETRTIVIPANATITITTHGETEARKAPAIKERTANGLTPLYVVRYTTNAGKTSNYGVFWEGPGRNGQLRVGLRKMLASGSRMAKQTRYNKGFFVDASRTQRVS